MSEDDSKEGCAEEDPPSSAMVCKPIRMSLGDLAGKSLSTYLLLHEDGLRFQEVSLTLISGATIVMAQENVTSRMISGNFYMKYLCEYVRSWICIGTDAAITVLKGHVQCLIPVGAIDTDSDKKRWDLLQCRYDQSSDFKLGIWKAYTATLKALRQ